MKLQKIIFITTSFLLTIIFSIFLGSFKSATAEVCRGLWWYDETKWRANVIPMTSSTKNFVLPSPIYISGSNVGIGTTSPGYELQVQGDISGTRLCIGSDCRNVWPSGGGGGGGIAGTGLTGQVTFWTGTSSVSGDNNLFWNNTNKRLGIGTTTPQTSIHVIGNVTADTFLGTINASNVSSGQFGANKGGGNYSFPGKVVIGTTTPDSRPQVRLDVAGSIVARVNTPIRETDAANKAYVDAATRRPQYSQTCDDWSDKGWDSKDECIRDGRWHKIYSHNSTGNPTFGRSSDLRSHILAGSEVRVFLPDAGFGGSCDNLAVDTVGTYIICTTSVHWGSWNSMSNPPDQIHIGAIAYYTNGRVEYAYSSNIDSESGSGTSLRWKYQHLLRSSIDWYIKY